MTREEYLNTDVRLNGICDPAKGEARLHEYYSQFITPEITARAKYVINRFGKGASLEEWDRQATPCPADVARMLREAGDYPTLAGLVCLLKTTARKEGLL